MRVRTEADKKRLHQTLCVQCPSQNGGNDQSPYVCALSTQQSMGTVSRGDPTVMASICLDEKLE